MLFSGYFIALLITIILELVVLYYIRKRLYVYLLTCYSFEFTMLCMMLWCISLIAQILIINLVSADYAIYVDYFTYLPVVLTPVALFFVSYIFAKGEIHFKKWYLLLFIVPAITLIVLWTNDIHHLFYSNYSLISGDAEFGPYFYVHSLYTYGLFVVDIVMLLRTSVKKSSMLSKQSLLILVGALIPLLVNVFGMLFFSYNIYVTPISFIITILFLVLLYLDTTF